MNKLMTLTGYVFIALTGLALACLARPALVAHKSYPGERGISAAWQYKHGIAVAGRHLEICRTSAQCQGTTGASESRAFQGVVADHLRSPSLGALSCTASILNRAQSTSTILTTQCLPCEGAFDVVVGDCKFKVWQPLQTGIWTQPFGTNYWSTTVVSRPGLPEAFCGSCVGFTISCMEPPCIEQCVARIQCL